MASASHWSQSGIAEPQRATEAHFALTTIRKRHVAKANGSSFFKVRTRCLKPAARAGVNVGQARQDPRAARVLGRRTISSSVKQE